MRDARRTIGVWLTGAVLLGASLRAAPAAAQSEGPSSEAAATAEVADAPAGGRPAKGPAEGDGDGDGPSGAGVVLMVVGGSAFAVGATLLVVDAAKEPEEPVDDGLDPGLGGARGRAGQEPLDDDDTLPIVGATLLGVGALVHLIGVVLVFGEDEEEAPPAASAARIEPLVGPGFGGLRGRF